jgi:superfamily II DNA helicase RecQ
MDFERKLGAMGISFYTYDSNQPRIQLGSSNIILISADRVKWDAWKQALMILHQHRPVVRLIIDEAHIPVLSQDFRPSLQHMSDIRCSMPIQLVLLTASGHQELLAAMRAEYAIEDNAIVIHEPSNRPELKFVWQKVKDMAAMMEAIETGIQTSLVQESDRGIIFVPWKALGEDIAKRLNCPFYYGGHNDNPTTYQSWLAGHSGAIVVATSAFGTGNDYANVRLVVHAAAPYEMVHYVQEVSRAGRDGSSALCLLLLLSGPNIRSSHASAHPGTDLGGKEAMSKAVQRPLDQCIRYRITTYNDGPGRGVDCSSHEKNQLCSRCSGIQKAK